MCEDDDRLRSLYRALRSIHFDPFEKPSPWENLTDVLEILAVWQGIKPAHLSGHGFRSERLLVDLESVARQYGLLTLRTPPHRPHWHREPSVERGFLAWHQQRERHEASATGEVLWIYRDALLKTSIGLLLDGSVDETKVLGYPRCCVRARSEISTQLVEALVDGYRRQHGAVTVAELIRCGERDVAVALGTPIPTTEADSRRRFPFLQFTACADCLGRADSPAAGLNAVMQRLAGAVDTEFARQIRQAARREVTGRQPPLRGGPFSNDAAQSVGRDSQVHRPVRRNGRCPCGSGTKYKRCCGRRQESGARRLPLRDHQQYGEEECIANALVAPARC